MAGGVTWMAVSRHGKLVSPRACFAVNSVACAIFKARGAGDADRLSTFAFDPDWPQALIIRQARIAMTTGA